MDSPLLQLCRELHPARAHVGGISSATPWHLRTTVTAPIFALKGTSLPCTNYTVVGLLGTFQQNQLTPVHTPPQLLRPRLQL